MLTSQGFVETETKPTSNQIMPHSIEAETALLGALILDPAQFLDVGYLESSDFYLFNNGVLYEAMHSLFHKHSGYDWLTIANHLRSTGHLDDIGGEMALADLINATPTSYGAPEYAAIIYLHSISRQVIQAGLAITQEAYKNVAGRSGDLLVNEAIDRLSGIDATRNVSNGPQLVRGGLNRLLDRMEQIQEHGNISGISTGLKSLDRLLGGLRENKFYLLAGRPGMGKSGLALQIAYNLARRGLSVLYFSLEMSSDDIAARLVSSICGVPYESFNRPGVSEWGKVINACEQVSKLPLIIDDTPGLTVASIRAITQKTMLKYPIKLIIIDHGGIVKPPKPTGDPYRDMSQNADHLMALPKQLGLPVLSLLQLSRTLESRQNKRPMMHDIRDSGKWEENADAILFLYRDDVYNPDTEMPGLGEIIVAKNRAGSIGTFTLAANVRVNRYTELEIRNNPLDY